MKLRLTLVAVLATTLAVSAQQAGDQMPRFRAGANLVRVDAYFTKGGVAVTDLKPEDVEIFEDDKPQKIENMELIAARGGAATGTTPNPTNVGQMRDEASAASRLFTLFFDTYHVSLRGSYRAQSPVVTMLDKIVGPDDLVGAMTPDISPGNVTYSRRTSSIESFVRDTWNWGDRDRVNHLDPRDAEIEMCYPDSGKSAGIAAEMIARRHEQKTLDALDNLVTHLDGLRPERKFVVIFTEGWPLFRANEGLSRALDGGVPSGDPVTVDPRGRLSTSNPQDGGSSTLSSCERERVMLSYVDHQISLRELAQRANRANVSFYPVDARGLSVFDQDLSTPLDRLGSPGADMARLRDKQENLRTLALQTDGVAVLDTNATGPALERIFTDLGAYYLMSYYSTNPKLDGRFRRIGVRVKRDGVDVRARPGYLAPTESEARAAGVAPARTPPKGGLLTPMPSAAPPSVTRALDAIAPARGNLPVRIQAAGGAGLVRAVVELDAATLKLPEWLSGGNLTVTVAPERGGGATQTITAAFGPGQRSVAIVGPETRLEPGRYSIRAEVKPKASRAPVQVTTFVTVPPASAEVGTGAVALRRGPSTGLAYVPTADPRFRRTERLRIEVPLMAEGFTPTAKLLTREGQPMPLIVSYSARVDEATQMRLGVAEVVLSPLAEGEYVLQISLEKGGKTEEITYGFRIVPY